MADVISLDLRRAIQRTGMTQRQFAEAIRMSPETIKNILYQDKLTSLPSLYWIAVVAGELHISGPNGTVAVIHKPDDRPTPPAAPARADRRQKAVA